MMGQLRITFIGIGLFINRPLGMSVLLPSDKHSCRMAGSFGEIPLTSVDVRITKNRQALTPLPTGRASCDYIPHVDHVYGTRVIAPPALYKGPVPGHVNARMSLTGGALEGLPAIAYDGQLRDVIWVFDPAGARKTPYGQRLTDTSVYRCELATGNYEIELTTAGGVEYHAFTIGDAPQDITILNDDVCPPLPAPDYVPEESGILFILAGMGKEIPKIQGIPSTAVRRAQPNARRLFAAQDPSGCACDPICPHMQVDADA